MKNGYEFECLRLSRTTTLFRARLPQIPFGIVPSGSHKTPSSLYCTCLGTPRRRETQTLSHPHLMLLTVLLKWAIESGLSLWSTETTAHCVFWRNTLSWIEERCSCGFRFLEKAFKSLCPSYRIGAPHYAGISLLYLHNEPPLCMFGHLRPCPCLPTHHINIH